MKISAVAMSTTEERLSWAAIILAGAAFIISVSQALQQYLATAEGYRRCQKAVSGPWAKEFTHRELRLKELRFETLFGTPRIILTSLFDQQHCLLFPDKHLLANCGDELVGRLVPNETEVNSNSNVNWACWLRVLEELKDLHTKLLQSLPKDRRSQGRERIPTNLHELQQIEDGSQFVLNFPYFIPEKQSWDFVPADVLRPLAIIGLSDLAICMRRMGLKWVQFQPMDALLRAEGNNSFLNSSYLRAVGCVVTYTRLQGTSTNKKIPREKYKIPREKYLIPCVQADAMGFGLLPSCHSNAKPFLNLSTASDVLDVFKSFQPPEEALERLRDLSQRDKFLYAFIDLIPLTAPFMRRKSSSIVRIPAPIDRPFWLFHSNTGRTAFSYLLRKEITRNNLNFPLFIAYETLVRDRRHLNYANQKKRTQMESNNEEIPLLDRIQNEFEKVQHYFITKSESMYEQRASAALAPVDSTSEEAHRAETGDQSGKSSLYSDLVTVHVRHAVLADKYAERNLKESGRAYMRYAYPEDMRRLRNWNKRMAESLGQYTHRWKYMMQDLQELGWMVENEVDFLEIWFHMMLRGFYWEFCHFMVEEPRVSAKYWNSKMPIYIG